jgi:hypothetical protein
MQQSSQKMLANPAVWNCLQSTVNDPGDGAVNFIVDFAERLMTSSVWLSSEIDMRELKLSCTGSASEAQSIDTLVLFHAFESVKQSTAGSSKLTMTGLHVTRVS